MSQLLSALEIANIIGVEEIIVKHTLERRDADLAGYLHEPGLDATTSEEATANLRSQTPLLSFEGLPLLITKLAFNISPTDIIENLSCQIIHLMLIQNENKNLAEKNKELQQRNEQLQRQIKELQNQVENLQAEIADLTEAASRKSIWKRLGLKK
jgi:hypothetical protein